MERSEPRSTPSIPTHSFLPTTAVAGPVGGRYAWTRANIAEVLPDVVTPLTWSLFRHGLLNRPLAVVDAPDAGGERAEAEGIRLHAGKAYLRTDKLLDRFCRLPGVTPEIVHLALGLEELPRDTAAPHQRRAGMRERTSAAIWLIDLVTGLPLLRFRVHRYTASYALSGEPGAGIESIESVLARTTRCFQLHLHATAYAIGAYGLTLALLRRWLPAEADKLAPALLTGLKELQTARQGLSLWQLAHRARQSPELESALVSGGDWDAAAAAALQVPGGGEWLAAFAEFRAQNGSRAVGEFELRNPRWHEDPGFLLTTLRTYLQDRHLHDPATLMARWQEERDFAMAIVEREAGRWRAAILSRLMALLSTCVTERENMKYRLMTCYDLLRRRFLMLARDLVDRGLLQSTGDVFFLTASEALALVSGHGSVPDSIERIVQERRAIHDRWQAIAAPPGKAEQVSSGALQSSEESTTLGQDVLRGISCSPGVGHGRARVMHDISSSSAFQPGEILVAPSTDPGWTPLFLSAAGVVTEMGGFLSHGATVAREYRVPAVVSVSSACSAIRTGDLVTVDGNRGLVHIHHERHFP
ncbi:MAG: hypothetical protein JXA93_01730 [Anaerolineae bacterium]|nr:hypothetical protein [Anaerolineae bacterium]